MVKMLDEEERACYKGMVPPPTSTIVYTQVCLISSLSLAK